MFVATTGIGRITNHKVSCEININIKTIVVLYNTASDKLLIPTIVANLKKTLFSAVMNRFKSTNILNLIS